MACVQALSDGPGRDRTSLLIGTFPLPSSAVDLPVVRQRVDVVICRHPPRVAEQFGNLSQRARALVVQRAAPRAQRREPRRLLCADRWQVSRASPSSVPRLPRTIGLRGGKFRLLNLVARYAMCGASSSSSSCMEPWIANCQSPRHLLHYLGVRVAGLFSRWLNGLGALRPPPPTE
jgi:hypothetical protein